MEANAEKTMHVVHGPLPPIDPNRDTLRDLIPWEAIGGKPKEREE